MVFDEHLCAMYQKGSLNESFCLANFTVNELSDILPDIVETCLQSKKGSDMKPLFSFMNMQATGLPRGI